MEMDTEKEELKVMVEKCEESIKRLNHKVNKLMVDLENHKGKVYAHSI